MPKVKYDFTGVEDIQNTPAPVGLYRAKIEMVDGPKPSSSGNQMLEVRFQLTHDAAGKALNGQFMPVWYYPLLDKDVHPLSAARAKEFFLAVGLRPKGTLDTDKLPGTSVQLRLGPDKDQNDEYRPRITKVMALPEQDEPEDEEEPDEPEAEAEGDDEAPDLDSMDRAALKALIKDEGLDVKVLKKHSDDDIRKAIVEAWPDEEEDEEEEPEDEAEEDEEEEAEEEEADDDESDGYDEMSVAELKAELKERELKTNGARKVLIGRLRADDGEEPF